MATLRDYYVLMKPGIVTGNAYHVLAGIFLAYQFAWSWLTAIGVFVGTCAMIASACIVNNYFDRHEDAKMARTQGRPLADGTISGLTAATIAMALLVGGLALLIATTNWLTVVLGVVAYASYAFVYTYMKRVTSYNTIVGTIPGALPGVAGYTAFSGQLDAVAWLIFVVLALWQLPHFYAIAIRRRKEYASTSFKFVTASLDKRTVWLMITALTVVYAVTFTYLAIVMMHWVLVVIVCAACAWWIWLTSRQPVQYTQWAKSVFGGSLLLMMVFCLTAFGNFVIEKMF